MSNKNPSAGLVRGPVNKSPKNIKSGKGSQGQVPFSRSFYYSLGILIITFITFFPSLKNDFMNTWDDEKYVTGNPIVKELSLPNIGKMFTKQVNGSYVPLPLLTFAIENELAGNEPLLFHITNLMLHLICTLLVFQVLRLLKLDLIYAAFGALLFGIHPMRVESVAWITERKDVLYSLFYLASVIMYIRYIESPHKRKLLLYSILLFLGSLLSKIEAVTIPLSLLLIDYLLKRPFSWKLITEKIPYFILSLLFGILGILIIILLGRHGQEILKTEEVLGFTDRFFYGLFAVTGYIIKFIVPYSQSAEYPYPVMTGWTMVWIRFINPAVIVALIFLVIRSVRKTRVIVFGSLFFLVNIFFLLQIVAVGNAFFADRYTYMPYFGLIFIMVWFASEIVRRNSERKISVITWLSVFAGICTVLTFSRCQVWKDGVSLWSNVISQYPGRSMKPYANRGISYMAKQQWEDAADDFTTALSIGPETAGVYGDRGIVYGYISQPENAIADFSKAIALNPKISKYYYNRGVTYGNLGQTGKAIWDFRKVIDLDPKNLSGYAGLGLMLITEKKFDTCRILAEKGLKIDPERSELYTILGNCDLETGNPDKAIDMFKNCLRTDTKSLDAILGLAAAYTNKEDREKAYRYLVFARQVAQEKNFGLNNMVDIINSGITLLDKKKEALQKLLAQKP